MSNEIKIASVPVENKLTVGNITFEQKESGLAGKWNNEYCRVVRPQWEEVGYTTTTTSTNGEPTVYEYAPPIPRVGHFEKVSFPQFCTAMKETFGEDYTEDDLRYMYDVLEIPTRATKGSAGYDFKAPIGFNINPGEAVKIPTGIRAIINPGWFLQCVPRSGMGFKYGVRLNNTLGIIDSDYSQSSNEGHIFVKLHNIGPYNKTISISRGDGIFQGLFIPHGITIDDFADTQRDGGFGSTGK